MENQNSADYQIHYDKYTEYITSTFVISFILRFFDLLPAGIIKMHISNYAITGCLLMFIVLVSGFITSTSRSTGRRLQAVLRDPLSFVSRAIFFSVIASLIVLNASMEIFNVNQLNLLVGNLKTENTSNPLDFLSGMIALIPICLIYWRKQTVNKV